MLANASVLLRRVRLAAPLLVLLLAVVLAPVLAQVNLQTTREQQLDLVQQRTSSLRELETTDPIRRVFMRRDELRDYYEKTFLEENPIEDLENSQYLLEVLGYIQPGEDIIKILLDVLGEEVLGFYDRETKSIYVISDGDGLSPAASITMAHEFTHSLQDQHFDLTKGFADRKDNNDRSLAYQALVEGDAVLLQSVYSLRHLSESERRRMYESEEVQAQARAIETAPLVLQRELYFPYEEGTNFVLKPYLDGSWPSVNQLWTRPPESTEQILHPEKYQANEGPISVELPDMAAATGPEWRKLTEDTLGELDTRILIEQYVEMSTAIRAASGWGGDRFHLIRRDRDGALGYQARTVWDSETDAIEFFNAYRQVVEGRHGPALQPIDASPFLQARPTSRTPNESWAGTAGSWHHAIVRDGATVAIVTATDSAPLNAINLLW